MYIKKLDNLVNLITTLSENNYKSCITVLTNKNLITDASQFMKMNIQEQVKKKNITLPSADAS